MFGIRDLHQTDFNYLFHDDLPFCRCLLGGAGGRDGSDIKEDKRTRWHEKERGRSGGGWGRGRGGSEGREGGGRDGECVGGVGGEGGLDNVKGVGGERLEGRGEE